ncbi:MAG: ABC transporter permease [Conexivisphaera sp.]|jgi:ABC-2 type transport system permease protein
MPASSGVRHALLIARKDLTEFYRVKPRLVTMIMFPVILMLLFGYMFPSGGTINHVPIAVVVQDQSPQGLKLSQKFTYLAQSSGLLDVKSTDSLHWAQLQLMTGNVYAVVIFHQGLGAQLSSGTGTVEVILDQLNPTLDSAVRGEIQQVFSEMDARAAAGPTLDVVFQGLVPGATGSFEFLAPGMIAMTAIVGGLSGLAMTFSRERELGTLDGLLMAPISRLSILFGKGLAQIVRGAVSSAIVFAISVVLFNVRVYGNPLLMVLVLLEGILAFTGMGMLFTSFVSDQESAQLIMLMIQFPMIFLSGALFPLLQLPWWLRMVSYILPLTYVVSAFRAEMVLNAPFSVIAPEVYGLAVFTVVVFALAVPLFQRAVTR